MGEVKLAFPDQDNECHHDLKLLPQFQGKGIGYKAWRVMLERTHSRWPGAVAVVTPSIDNLPALALYSKLGFQIHGETKVWQPRNSKAVAVSYKTMIYNKF
jgi:ribosomal protein S18 acetylase RimI-like enzyme